MASATAPTPSQSGLTDRQWLLRGALGIAVYLVLAAAPVAVMMLGGTGGRTFMRELSVALAFSGLSVLGLQLLLTARFKTLKAPYGIDAVYHFHREISLAALALVVAHPVLLIVEAPATLALFDVISAPVRARFAVAATVAMALVIVLSYFRRQLRIGYELWRRTHGLLALITLVAAVVHVELVGYHVSTPAKRVLWILYPTIWVVALVWSRLIRPARMVRAPWTVEEVRPERGRSWTLRLAPPAGVRFSFDAGQFVWLHLGHSPFSMAEHPFSISSSAQDADSIELTIKELGDFTAAVGKTAPGTRAYLDGPYGQFSVDRHRAPRYGFIAGGVGITPVMSMLRTLADRQDRRPLTLLYAAATLEDMTFREEIEQLAESSLDLTFVPLPARLPADWNGRPSGFITNELLLDVFGHRHEETEYFVCGPEPMMRAVAAGLHAVGVHPSQVRYELFGLV